jgi:hypothetical protein
MKQTKKAQRKQLAVRVLCLVLAALMCVGSVAMIISLL